MHLNISDMRYDISKSSFWHDFIPNIIIYKKKFKQDCDFYLEVFNNKKPKFQIKKKHWKLYIDFNSNYTEKDIIVVAGYCLERLRQERWIYTFHWSLLFNRSLNMGIGLFWWISWIGKSTLANYFHRKNEEWFFWGDEKYLINPFSKLVYKSNIKLDKKTHDIGIKNETPIWLFVVPIVTAQSWSFEIHEFSHLKKKRHFYEEMTRDVRLLNGLIAWFNYPLPSLDNIWISRKRIIWADLLAKEVGCFFIKWTTQEIYNAISALITSSK